MTEATIAAIATAPGQGGIGIVRLSGTEAEPILMRLFRPARQTAKLQSHRLTYGHLIDGETVVDECMAVLMRAPHSYTREDVVEFQLHGGSFLCRRVLALCLREGAVLAQPGEFTRRAFLNGRLDLSEAEAVMALIAADGEAARQNAMQQLMGGASGFVRQAADELYAIEAGAAACIDYPEEISEEEAASDALPRLEKLDAMLASAVDEHAAHLVRDGLQVALVGRPNVGKSSLLNALLGEEKAIVTAIPGTTRDLVQGSLTLNGTVVHLVDTAGMHETDDPVERIGVTRSDKAMKEADWVLLLLDASLDLTAEDEALLAGLNPERSTVVLNKSDLPMRLTEDHLRQRYPQLKMITLSTAQPNSLQPLKALLAGVCEHSDLLVLTQPRHLDAVARARAGLRRGMESLRRHAPIDLALVDLQMAAAALAEITGDQADEKLLDAVFSQFCVGK